MVSMRVVAAASLCAAASLTVGAQQTTPVPPPPPASGPERPTNLGQDANGNPLRLARRTGHVSNYSEDKAPTYTLPDPLVLANGRKVTTAEMWVKERRPEILTFYRTGVYGTVPDNAPKVTWEVAETDDTALKGAAVTRHVVGRMGDKPKAFGR